MDLVPKSSSQAMFPVLLPNALHMISQAHASLTLGRQKEPTVHLNTPRSFPPFMSACVTAPKSRYCLLLAFSSHLKRKLQNRPV